MKKRNLKKFLFLCYKFYTKAVFLRTTLLAIPSPTENKPPPTAHKITCNTVAFNGVVIAIIGKNSMPIPSEQTNESQVFCFAITEANKKVETNIEERNIFEIIQNITFAMVTPSRANGRLAIAPPSIAPIKKRIKQTDAHTKQTTNLDIT